MGSYHEQQENQRMMDEMGDLLLRLGLVALLLGAVFGAMTIAFFYRA